MKLLFEGCSCKGQTEDPACSIPIVNKPKVNPVSKLDKLQDSIRTYSRENVHLIRDDRFVPIANELWNFDLGVQDCAQIVLNGPIYSAQIQWITEPRFFFGPNRIVYGLKNNKFFITEDCNGTTKETLFDDVQPLVEHFETSVDKRKAVPYNSKEYKVSYTRSTGKEVEKQGVLFVWAGGVGPCQARIDSNPSSYWKRCGVSTNLIMSVTWAPDNYPNYKLVFVCEPCAKKDEIAKTIVFNA